LKSYLQTENWSKSIWLLILPILGLGFYVLYILIFNVDKGFDITDESFYILNSTNPDSVNFSVTSFGFYTNLLFQLSGEQLKVFRLLGILLLLLSTLFFSKELYKYAINLTKQKETLEDFLLFSFPIIMGSTAYYAAWIITPSYNWLALVGVILFGTGILRHVNNYKAQSRFDFSSILVAFGGCITFFAKPTSAILLVLLLIIWLVVHIKYIRLKIFLLTVSLSSFFVINFHILFFEKGYINYYSKIINGLELTKLLDGGYSSGNLLKRSIDIVPETIEKFYIYNFANNKSVFILLFSVAIIIAVLRIKKTSPHKILALNIALGLALLIYAGMIYFGSTTTKVLWVFIIELSAFLFFWILIIKLSKFNNQNGTDNTRKFLFLAFFLNLLNFAYVFGTNNNMQVAMSFGALFSFASLVILGSWFKDNKTILLSVNIIAVLYIFVVINNAYENPYRLVENIGSQTIKVGLLKANGDNDYIKVDVATANYINSLQDIALKNGWNTGDILIDMSGGSPGANVILGADFVGTPWLLGGYSGSKEFSLFVLSRENSESLTDAWILSAPNGRRKLPEEILNEIGLNFPEDYKIAGSVKTAYREEVQILWKRRSSLK